MGITLLGAADAKDPASTKDYAINWTDYLEGDSISDSEWVKTQGSASVVLSDPTHTTTLARIWVTGGVVGEKIVLTNKITTAAGREDERSILIPVRDM